MFDSVIFLLPENRLNGISKSCRDTFQPIAMHCIVTNCTSYTLLHFEPDGVVVLKGGEIVKAPNSLQHVAHAMSSGFLKFYPL